jgi:hypothetical protein
MIKLIFLTLKGILMQECQLVVLYVDPLQVDPTPKRLTLDFLNPFPSTLKLYQIREFCEDFRWNWVDFRWQNPNVCERIGVGIFRMNLNWNCFIRSDRYILYFVYRCFPFRYLVLAHCTRLFVQPKYWPKAMTKLRQKLHFSFFSTFKFNLKEIRSKNWLKFAFNRHL